MTHFDLQSEAFEQLLADALRAGPGSPEWRQAVTTLRAHEHAPLADDYQLLITARERLESGRMYRSVRPGPEFTRKVMQQVDSYRPDNRRWSSLGVATALLAVGMLLAVAILIGQFTGTREEVGADLQALAQTYFVTPHLMSDFDQALNDDWQPVGSLRVNHSFWGLRVDADKQEYTDYRGGGIVTATPIPAAQAFAVEAQLRARNVNDDLIPQVFVTDTPEFSAELGTSPHELAWLVKSGRATVALPDGRFVADAGNINRNTRQPLTIRIVVNDRFALVESGGERLWAGEHQLDPTAPRYVGIRFLRRDAGRNDQLAFPSLKILLPQTTP